MKDFENYRREASDKWGDTAAYKEYEGKTKGYTKVKWDALSNGMSGIFARFSECMSEGAAPESPKAQNLVKTLQNHITENYYLCTNEILAGLGKMYVADERFKNYIDRGADGTARFVCKAIEVFCKE